MDESAIEATKLAIRFLFNTLARAKDREFFNMWMHRIKRVCDGNLPLSRWVLETAIQPYDIDPSAGIPTKKTNNSTETQPPPKSEVGTRTWLRDLLLLANDQRIRSQVSDLLVETFSRLMRPRAVRSAAQFLRTKTNDPNPAPAPSTPAQTTAAAPTTAPSTPAQTTAAAPTTAPSTPAQTTAAASLTAGEKADGKESVSAGDGKGEAGGVFEEDGTRLGASLQRLWASGDETLCGRFVNAVVDAWKYMVGYSRERSFAYLRLLNRCASCKTGPKGVTGAAPSFGEYLVRSRKLLVSTLDLFLGEHKHAGCSGVTPEMLRAWRGHIHHEAQIALLPLLKTLVVLCEPVRLGEVADKTSDCRASLMPLSELENTMLIEALPKLLPLGMNAHNGAFVCRIVTHMCHENPAASVHVSDLIKKGLEAEDFDRARGYLRVVSALLAMDDKLGPKRLDHVLGSFTGVIHKQRNWWRMTDYCLEHLIRMASQFTGVARWLHANDVFLRHMIRWLEQFQEPPMPATYSWYGHATENSGQPSLLKRLTSTYVDGEGAGGWDALMKHHGRKPAEKLTFLQTIVNCAKPDDLPAAIEPLATASAATATAKVVEDDSDMDLADRKFKVGQLVDCWCRTKWFVARIARVSGDRVEVTFPGYIEQWNESLDVSDNRLATLGSRCSKEQVNDIINSKY